jgi:hypothetical protein
MIQSVQNQTLTDWEIILINDQSPLSLDPVKMQYAGDSRLRWFENATNYGPAMTRNTAVALAESQCLLPLDADDMLADNEVLEVMYDAWLMDQSKTIYGNVQLYKEVASGIYERSKVHQLASYTFEGAMHLEWGVMPVTTMHSKEAHYAAGGWKPELTDGREDLEYWIACGKAGFCGHKVQAATLLYRKHEQSRDYKLKFENKQLSVMQQKIKELHSDIYIKGVFPMACCGKGSSSTPASDPVIISQQNQKLVRIVTTLDGYNEENLEWVAYRGPKQGRSGSILTRGPINTPSEYPILGTGHVFQIHKNHRKLFEDRQKLGFEMNQPDPRVQSESEPERLAPPVETPRVVEMPPPQLSTIVRPDSVAAQTREVEIRPAPAEVIVEPNPPQSVSYSMPIASLDVSNLQLSEALTQTLDDAGYTIEELAKITPQQLSSLPGIGTKRANSIIAKAQKYLAK